MLSDALCRLADYDFGQHRCHNAIDYYAKVIDMGIANLDYATFQSGLCYGLTGNTAKKIDLMNSVIEWKPASPYADGAKFEKGRTYVQMQDYPRAIAVYNELLRRPSALYPKALIELGLIYVNSGKPQEAMQYYKQAIEEYAGTPEMRTALVGMRNIYVEMGSADGYFTYISGLQGYGGANDEERDSVSFAAAQHAYFADNHLLAASLLDKYIADFPQGIFWLDAHFYLADTYLRLNRDSAAVPHYQAVIARPKNEYTENALDALSAIAFNFEWYDRAADYYGQFAQAAASGAALAKARRGKALTAYMRQNYAEVIDEATALLAEGGISDPIRHEMLYIRAKSYEQTSQPDSAYADFAAIAPHAASKEGAEAAYKAIEYHFGQGHLDRAESQAIRFSKSGSPHQYWIARAFVLLGDIYVQRGDAFQAKATYESILDGYSPADDGIRDAVRRRIEQLLEREAQKDREAAQSRYGIVVKS